MSNFICSECGMNNIDCGRNGYKTLKEIELEKQIERLQEQINEANAIIEGMRPFIQASMSRQIFTRILNYEDKWGIK